MGLRILAIDISNLFTRNWEVCDGGKDFSEAFNKTVAAVQRFREGYDRVAICCDAGKSWRRAVWPEYKANRPDRGEAYRAQIQRTIERLEADGCSIFRAPMVQGDYVGFSEADDVIASLCSWAVEGGHEVVILSSDKDLLRLVGPGVSVLHLANGEVYDAARVAAKMLVEPARIADLLALAGDTSDNFKPYAGIADKTAVNLIGAFGGALAVFDAPNLARVHEVIGDAKAKTLREAGREPAEKALTIALLQRDLPIDFSPLLAEPQVRSVAASEPAAVTPPALALVPPALPPPQQQAAQDASHAIVVSRANPWALQPSGQKSLWQMATWLATARVFPNLGTPEQIIAATILGQNLGVPMGLALMHAYAVYGRIGWSAAFIVGLVRRSSDCEKFYISETRSDGATVVYKRRGEPEGSYVFSLEQARKAGWIKRDGVWDKRPDVMCRWAALRECARMVWPDVVAGVYMPDEITGGDIPEEMWKEAA